MRDRNWRQRLTRFGGLLFALILGACSSESTAARFTIAYGAFDTSRIEGTTIEVFLDGELQSRETYGTASCEGDPRCQHFDSTPAAAELLYLVSPSIRRVRVAALADFPGDNNAVAVAEVSVVPGTVTETILRYSAECRAPCEGSSTNCSDEKTEQLCVEAFGCPLQIDVACAPRETCREGACRECGENCGADAAVDGGEADGGRDGGERDVGIDADRPDRGIDMGRIDLGTPDIGPLDTGVPDTGPIDTGVPDSGPIDMGTPDMGVPDMGSPDAGVCTWPANPAGDCNVERQTGCGAGRKCVIRGGRAQCTESGGKGEGELCNLGECAAGLDCHPISGRNICRRICPIAAPCACPRSGDVCGFVESGYGVCLDGTCDPIDNTGCEAPDVCGLLNGLGTHCRRPGTVGEGGACTPGACISGYHCIARGPGNFQCARTCSLATPACASCAPSIEPFGACL